jgi:Replicase family/Primase C terminal 1 (PriCT-1)
MTEPSFEGAFTGHWLPHAPLAGVKTHQQRMNRDKALREPYIESNPLVLRSLVVIDHDGGEAEHAAALSGLPAPSYVALNPHTKDGHIIYALASPVCLTDAASRRPVNLLARIESGLTTILGGDVGYGGRITKNPYHQDHLPVWGNHEAVYGLQELAAALSDLGALPKWNERQLIRNTGIGRNVALFDAVRHWAYRAWTRYPDKRGWEEAVHAYAWNKNLGAIAEEFSAGPLSEVEVTHLARSIARFVWRSDLRGKGAERFEQDFIDIQRRRGRKGSGRNGGLASGLKRTMARDERLLQALEENHGSA